MWVHMHVWFLPMLVSRRNMFSWYYQSQSIYLSCNQYIYNTKEEHFRRSEKCKSWVEDFSGVLEPWPTPGWCGTITGMWDRLGLLILHYLLRHIRRNVLVSLPKRRMLISLIITSAFMCLCGTESPTPGRFKLADDVCN